jgi:hypothetical protein
MASSMCLTDDFDSDLAVFADRSDPSYSFGSTTVFNPARYQRFSRIPPINGLAAQRDLARHADV